MINTIPASQYCDRVFDGTHETPKACEIGRPLVTSKNIVGGTLDKSTAYNISEDDYVAIQQRSYVSQWDILFSMIGSVGEVYIEKNPTIDYAVKNVGVFSCLNEDRALWLYYYLKSATAQKIIKNQLNGAVQKFLSLGALRKFPVPLFDSSKISAVKLLSALDAKIELNNRLNAELEGMAKLLYDYWFVLYDFPLSAAQATALGQPHLTGHPYRTSAAPMLYNEQLKRNIPQGWEVGNLERLCSMVRGVTYSKSDVRTSTDSNTVPILRATNVNNGIVDLSDLVFVTEDMPSEEQYLDKFDILVVMSSGSKAHVGKNALYCYDQRVAYGAFCSKVVPNTSNRFFVAVHMQSDPFKKYISNVCRGTSINNLTNDHITKHQLPLPPKELLQKFEKAVSPYFETIAINHQQNQELARLRDWLLPMLMNGQVTVG
jgi:type I restriction enzyme S subunit